MEPLKCHRRASISFPVVAPSINRHNDCLILDRIRAEKFSHAKVLVSESERSVSERFHWINLAISTFVFIFFRNIATFGACDATSEAHFDPLETFSGPGSSCKRKFGFQLGYPMFIIL